MAAGVVGVTFNDLRATAVTRLALVGATEAEIATMIVQLGLVTEELNRRWYEANTGEVITDIQKQIRHPGLSWMAATLGGRVESSGAVFETKFMLPWSFSEESAAEKYMPQLQHNMWVIAAKAAVLSIITWGGKWVEIKTHADPLYQHLIVTAGRKFWRCVESGERPTLFGVEPPRPWIEAVRIVDMSTSNAWAEYASTFIRTREAHLEHEKAKAELRSLVPEDARQAIGHGIRAKRSKSGAIGFDLLHAQGEPCGSLARPSAALPALWPKPRPSSPTLRNHSWPPFGPMVLLAPLNARSAMRRSPAGLRS
jgi:hypothetical protein